MWARFYVTGTGKRMRYVAKDPFANGSLIRIAADGKSYDILAEQPIPPTSELPSHLLCTISCVRRDGITGWYCIRIRRILLA